MSPALLFVKFHWCIMDHRYFA